MLQQKLPKYLTKDQVVKFLQKAKRSKRDLALFYTSVFQRFSVFNGQFGLNLQTLWLRCQRVFYYMWRYSLSKVEIHPVLDILLDFFSAYFRQVSLSVTC